MPRALVLFNPAASRAPSEGELAPILRSLRERGWSVALQRTTGPGGATALAKAGVASGCDVIIAAGGDGTVNEVVQGLAHSDAMLGVLPLGMVNIWAQEIGLPQHIGAAVQSLANGEVRRVDLGLADWGNHRERYFLLMAGIGFDAEVVQRTRPHLKRTLGPFAYIWNGVLGALGSPGANMEIDLPGETLRRKAMLALAGNTRLYAGGVRVTPAACMDDGLLDLCLFTGRGFWRAALYAAELLVGCHRRDAAVLYRRAACIAVHAAPPLPVQLDGELAGVTPVTLRVAPLALRVIVPRGMAARLLAAGGPAEGLS